MATEFHNNLSSYDASGILMERDADRDCSFGMELAYYQQLLEGAYETLLKFA